LLKSYVSLQMLQRKKGFVAYVTITSTKDFVETACVASDVVAERKASLRLSQFPGLKILLKTPVSLQML